MMRKRIWLTILLVVLMLAAGVTVAQAQDNGAIRGTLYNDTNADGVCGEGDPRISGVPITFTHSGGHTITLTSGNDGTYGLAGVSLGTWSVAAQPLQGWSTTSQTPLVVTLTAGNNVAASVNFCLAQVTATQPIAPTPTPTPIPTPVPPTTLPESGAAFPPSLAVVVGAGVVLLLVGLGLIVRGRRATS